MLLTEEQATIAAPLLNSYAHQYLGLNPDDILVASGRTKDNAYVLIVAQSDREEARTAFDFDQAKEMIDALAGAPTK